MSSTVATDLYRVVLVTPTSSAEIALPATARIGDLLPALLHHSGAAVEGTPDYEQGWVLQRLGETPLEETATPASSGIREGETLYLRPAGAQLPPSHFDDLIDGIAAGIQDRKDRWQASTTRWSFLATCGLLLAFGLWLSWSGPPLVRGMVTAVVTMLLLLGAAACSRALADRSAALMLAILAIPYAALTGLVVPMTPGSGALSPPSLMCAGIAVALTAMVGLAAVGSDPALFTMLAVVGLSGVVGGALGTISGLPGPEAAGLTLGLTLVLSVFAPGAAFRLARLQLPMLPTGVENLNEDIEPVPGPALLARTEVADRYLTALFVAAGVTYVGSFAVVLRGDGWLPVALCLAGAAVLLLRSRALMSTWQRLSAMVPAGAAIGLVLAGAAAGTDWVGRFGLVLVPLLGVTVATIVGARTLPGRRIHPLWGRIGDVGEWIAAIALVLFLLGHVGVFAWARQLFG